MSKYATPDKRSIIYSKETTPIPEGWKIIFEGEHDGLVHEGDILFTMGGVFKSIPALEAEHGLKEIGQPVTEKLCVIRKIDPMSVENGIEKQPAKRMKKGEFLNELNGLHRHD